MNQYLVEGEVEYLLFCPKAPDLDALEMHINTAACPGHGFCTRVAFYVDAPDADRAEWKALDKVKGALPWPRFTTPPQVSLIERPRDEQRSFNDLLPRPGDGIESITLSQGDRAVTLTGRH